MRPHHSHHASRETSTASTSRISNDQRSDWELNCEVCLKHTRNQVRTIFSFRPSRSNLPFIRTMAFRLCVVVHVMFGNTSPATKRGTVEMVNLHAIGKERSFIVLAVAQSPLQMVVGQVEPSLPPLRSKPRCSFNGITVDLLPSPLDRHNPLMWECLWTGMIITKCPRLLGWQTDTRILTRCTTAIFQVCRPPWIISIRTYRSPTINLISEDSHRGTPNHLYTTRLITQMRTTRNPHITLVPFIQPIPTEQAAPPCWATIASRGLADAIGRLRQPSLYRSVEAGGPCIPKPDRSERRTVLAPPQTGVFRLRMSQVVLMSQLPPRTRLGITPDRTDLRTKLFNPSMCL